MVDDADDSEENANHSHDRENAISTNNALRRSAIEKNNPATDDNKPNSVNETKHIGELL
jgi:hypothetical protein